MLLTGVHHLTAISARPRDNLSFYTGLLGMRLVKKSVNQDDVSAYHLFYADGRANPGTDLTFFDFPAAPERRGSNSISRTGLRVAGENSLGYWRDRLKRAGGHTGEVTEVDGRLTFALPRRADRGRVEANRVAQFGELAKRNRLHRPESGGLIANAIAMPEARQEIRPTYNQTRLQIASWREVQ